MLLLEHLKQTKILYLEYMKQVEMLRLDVFDGSRHFVRAFEISEAIHQKYF